MEVYTAFASAAMDARRAQINRWYQRRDAGRGTPHYLESKADSYQSRVAARQERYRVELVASDNELSQLAEAVLRSFSPIHKAISKGEMEEFADYTRDLIERFVAGAVTQLAVASNENWPSPPEYSRD